MVQHHYSLISESTLTDKNQTTVPKSVRDILHLGKKDKINYSLSDDGSVVISKAKLDEIEDPVLDSFFAFLENDIKQHPNQLQSMPTELREQSSKLTEGIEVDLDAPLNG